MRKEKVTITATMSGSAKNLIIRYLEGMGYKFEVHVEKNPTEVIDEIRERYKKKKGLSLVDSGFLTPNLYYAIFNYKHRLYFGYTRRHPDDKNDVSIAYYLSLCRAMGWKDLEEELLKNL